MKGAAAVVLRSTASVGKNGVDGSGCRGHCARVEQPVDIVIGHNELMMLKGVEELQKQPLNRIHDGAERASKIVQKPSDVAATEEAGAQTLGHQQIITKTLELPFV